MNQYSLDHREDKFCDHLSLAKYEVQVWMAVLAKQLLFFHHVFCFLHFQINSKLFC